MPHFTCTTRTGAVNHIAFVIKNVKDIKQPATGKALGCDAIYSHWHHWDTRYVYFAHKSYQKTLDLQLFLCTCDTTSTISI